jgi:histidine ammonia-lyase
MNNSVKTFPIRSADLTYDVIESILKEHRKLVLSDEAIEKIARCRNYLDKKTNETDIPIYGVTTGFGSLCNKHISVDELSILQENLIKSHSCSVGKPVDADIVRLMLMLKAHALSKGYSGVQVETVQRILDFYNNDILPVVYDRGSLGASGDLAPLANLFLPLLGEGEVLYKGKVIKGSEVLNIFGWKPIKLKSKEGLALLNGTQFMAANGIKALIDAWHLVNCFDLFGAMSLEAYDGRIEPFFDCIQQVRPHNGQIETAHIFRRLLEGSEIISRKKEHVQDPYSFRCIPQVHGAVKDAMHHVTSILHTEINSVTDNPTVFPDDDLVVSGGNFHGEPLALAFDYMGVAIHELGNISERRVAQLILGQRGLPEFLVAKPGLNSGFMIPQYAAASMVSQNKMYAWPASCDSIVSSNGQEDLVSMGANAATKLHKIVDNLKYIAAIELMNAAQGIEFRRPLKSSPYIESVLAAYRAEVPFVADDVVMTDYITATMKFLDRFDVVVP